MVTSSFESTFMCCEVRQSRLSRGLSRLHSGDETLVCPVCKALWILRCPGWVIIWTHIPVCWYTRWAAGTSLILPDGSFPFFGKFSHVCTHQYSDIYLIEIVCRLLHSLCSFSLFVLHPANSFAFAGLSQLPPQLKESFGLLPATWPGNFPDISWGNGGAPHWQLLTVLHCLMLTVLKAAVSCMLSTFCWFQKDSESLLFCLG